MCLWRRAQLQTGDAMDIKLALLFLLVGGVIWLSHLGDGPLGGGG